MQWNEEGLFVFRPEAVESLISRDPEFYRPGGENTWESIARVSPDENGELLGYGARSLFETQFEVIIFAAGDVSRVFTAFTCQPATAHIWAPVRTREIADYTGQRLAWVMAERGV